MPANARCRGACRAYAEDAASAHGTERRPDGRGVRIRGVDPGDRREDLPGRRRRLGDQPVHPGVRHVDLDVFRPGRRAPVTSTRQGAVQTTPQSIAVDPHAREVADVAAGEDGGPAATRRRGRPRSRTCRPRRSRPPPARGRSRAAGRPAASAPARRAGSAATGRRARTSRPALARRLVDRTARRRGTTEPSAGSVEPDARSVGSAVRGEGHRVPGDERPGRTPSRTVTVTGSGERVGQEDDLAGPRCAGRCAAGPRPRRQRRRRARARRSAAARSSVSHAPGRRPRAGRTAARARRRRRPATASPTRPPADDGRPRLHQLGDPPQRPHGHPGARAAEVQQPVARRARRPGRRRRRRTGPRARRGSRSRSRSPAGTRAVGLLAEQRGQRRLLADEDGDVDGRARPG